jgi:Fe-S-cluster-containing dehydrogenase component
MSVPQDREFFIDPGRCIGCQACVPAASATRIVGIP